jgi:hypothetical protein
MKIIRIKKIMKIKKMKKIKIMKNHLKIRKTKKIKSKIMTMKMLKIKIKKIIIHPQILEMVQKFNIKNGKSICWKLKKFRKKKD